MLVFTVPQEQRMQHMLWVSERELRSGKKEEKEKKKRRKLRALKLSSL